MLLITHKYRCTVTGFGCFYVQHTYCCAYDFGRGLEELIWQRGRKQCFLEVQGCDSHSDVLMPSKLRFLRLMCAEVR